MRVSSQTVFATAVGVVVLVAVVAGLAVIGSPWQARQRRLDDERLGALQSLSTQMDAYRNTHGAIPNTIKALAEDQNGPSPSALRDPESGAPYEYRKTGPAAYQLCARFATTTDEDVPLHWRHGPGRTCFSLTSTVKATSP